MFGKRHSGTQSSQETAESSQEAPESSQETAESSQEAPTGLREFIAETDCIYNGSYVAAGTRIRAAAQAVPHFRAV